ncbi:hypothetical protein COK52_10235 [Bacillus thuringiensis]|nr:hypothetical protein COK52_10235 [Bacillus thuringiensis]
MANVKTQAAEETTIETQEEETKEESMLTNEEVMAMCEERTKPRAGMVYARLGRSYSNENYSSPKPQAVRGMAMSRNIAG